MDRNTAVSNHSSNTNPYDNKTQLKIFSIFFCERVINAWNNLPADVNFRTNNTFKRSIDLNWFIFLVFFDGIFNAALRTADIIFCSCGYYLSSFFLA